MSRTPAHPCVLIVDHAAYRRRRIAASIYRRGYDTLEARDEHEALRMLETRRFEICAIVLDPVARDQALRKRQVADSRAARVPVIALTASADDAGGAASGADDAILRPAIREELDCAIVRYCLEHMDVAGDAADRGILRGEEKPTPMKISARNSFAGKITAIKKGPVSTEVTVQIAPKLEIVSVITTSSAKKLKLKVGTKAYAIVKSDNVIIGTD